jgi:very-short-patch-repair endonuclease
MDAARPVRDRAWIYRRAMSLPEVLLWQALRGRKLLGLHFRRQHPIGPYILDFFCGAAMLCVEVDGQSHDFADRPVRDERRDAWLLSQGIRTVRISASTILSDVDDAVRTIVGRLEDQGSSSSDDRTAAAATPSPSALRAAGPPPEGEDLG